MPAIEDTASQGEGATNDELRFPPVTREHILHCSYDYWFPKYRSSCIRSRIIPLTPDFISYIQEDGIILADEDNGKSSNSANPDDDDDDDDWEPSFPTSSAPPPRPETDEVDSSSEEDSDDDSPTPPRRQPPNLRFPSLHASITEAIASLGGAACPKLNWSSPKDATWISRHPNTMKCTSANDVYILLKSSSFISHDLTHAFDGTIPAAAAAAPSPSSASSSSNSNNNNNNSGELDFRPVLVLRSYFNPLPSLEFRCFVKDRSLVAISQRDLNYYSFLPSLRPQIVRRAREVFAKMRFSFPEACFVFDVYIPEADYDDAEEEGMTLGRARLIDINPWAPRTDTLLFDWRELLDMTVARPLLGSASSASEGLRGEDEEGGKDGGWVTRTDEEDEEDEEEDEETEPEVRLVEKDDPAAYNFSSPQYSAHKLPKEVVDASLAGEGGIREFAQRWERMTQGR